MFFRIKLGEDGYELTERHSNTKVGKNQVLIFNSSKCITKFRPFYIIIRKGGVMEYSIKDNKNAEIFLTYDEYEMYFGDILGEINSYEAKEGILLIIDKICDLNEVFLNSKDIYCDIFYLDDGVKAVIDFVERSGKFDELKISIFTHPDRLYCIYDGDGLEKLISKIKGLPYCFSVYRSESGALFVVFREYDFVSEYDSVLFSEFGYEMPKNLIIYVREHFEKINV